MVTVIPNTNYKYGLIDSIEALTIPRGAASASLNWLTKGDHVELRRGQAYLGSSSLNSGNGKATGLKKVTTALNVEVLFGTYGQKLKYFDRTTEEWIENGSSLLGSAVVDSNGLGLEEIFMSEYVSPAGNQLFLNSPNCSGYYKIMVANPATSLNVYTSSRNFKGFLRIDTNRTLLWGRTADRTGVYGSYIDAQTYTTVTNESVGTGDGTTVTFTKTLAAITGTRTVFALTVTAGAITLSDNYNGTLSASDGSTGTINYITGALAVTFATAPANLAAVTTTYQWEDSNNGGVSDFTKSSPRTAGQGFIFRQDEGGGPMQYPAMYNQVYYCLHLKKTWVLNITQTDTGATNLPYREKVGIPNERASVETGDGIYYIDDSDQTDVKIRLLTYDTSGASQVIPVPVSNNLNLNDYRFDQAASFEWGDLLLFACGLSDSTQTINGVVVTLNNRTLVYNKLWKAWDILDYAATCFENYDGTLVAGDALSNNFMTLFSGFDDFDADAIENYWISDLDDLDIDGLKKAKKLYLGGNIGPEQKIKVSISVDNGPFVEVGGTDNAVGTTAYTRDGAHTYAIQGNGSYIDRAQSVAIGALVLGHSEIGGGSDGAVAYAYERLFTLRLDKFERIKIKYEAMGIGYASVSTQKYWDVRTKSQKVPSKYRG